MSGNILISTAYLPPVEYFSRISQADEILIEREENYIKQTYRNRCYILSSHGTHHLSVPVYLGSLHKTPVKEIRIDYSKRWQQVHLGAITAAYSSSPYYAFYFENIEKIILKKFEYLLDLNMDLLQSILTILNSEKKISYTTNFETPSLADNDFRYSINPKKKIIHPVKSYYQVFNISNGFVPGLSIIDLIFNLGPESVNFI